MNKICILFSALFFVNFTLADITLIDSTLPNYPNKLEKKEWLDIRETVNIEKTGIGKAMGKLEKSYIKIDIKKIAADIYCPGQPDMERYNAYKDEAEQELKKIKPLMDLVKKLKDKAEKTQKKLKKDKSVSKQFKDYLKDVISNAKDFNKSLKKVTKRVNRQLKNKRADVIRRIAMVKDAVEENFTNGFALSKDLQDTIENLESEDEKKEYFNANIQSAARQFRFFEHVANNAHMFVDGDKGERYAQMIEPWGNDGRGVGEAGGKDTTDEELDEYLKVIVKFKKWYDKQDM